MTFSKVIEALFYLFEITLNAISYALGDKRLSHQMVHFIIVLIICGLIFHFGKRDRSAIHSPPSAIHSETNHTTHPTRSPDGTP